MTDDTLNDDVDEQTAPDEPVDNRSSTDTDPSLSTNEASTSQSSGSEAKPSEDWLKNRIVTLEQEKQALAEQLKQKTAAEPSSEFATAPGADEQLERRAAQIAEQRLAQNQLNQACQKIYEAGVKDFPDFEAALKNFALFGGLPAPTLEAVTQIENGHQVLHHLGQHQDELAQVLALPSMPQAMALARLSEKLKSSSPKPLSKAPVPITPLGGHTRAEDNSVLSDDEWYARSRS